MPTFGRHLFFILQKNYYLCSIIARQIVFDVTFWVIFKQFTDMKKIIIATFALMLAVSCHNNKPAAPTTSTTADETTIVADTTNVLKVTGSDLAYVDIALVISECDLNKTEGMAMRTKIEKAQKKWAGKEEALAKKGETINKEHINLQEKYQKGLITTLDAQRQEQELQKQLQSLQSEAQSLQAAAQKEMGQLNEESMVLDNRMSDLIKRAISAINADGRYKMVVNAQSLLDADKSLDISSAVLAKVNELYRADKK